MEGTTAEHDAPSAMSPLQLLTSRSLWLMPLLRGLLFVVLGVLLMLEPLGTLTRLIVLFGIFLFLDGIVAVVQGVLNRAQIGWKWWLVQGGVDVVFAIIIMVWPGATALVLFYVLVVWALVLGIVAIIGSVALVRNRDLGWSWLLTIGLMSTLFGFLLVTRSTGAVDALELVVLVFGVYAFVSGAIYIVSVFSMRFVAQEIDRALGGESLVVEALIARADATVEAKAHAAANRAASKAARRGGSAADDTADPAALSGPTGVSSAVTEGRPPGVGQQ